MLYLAHMIFHDGYIETPDTPIKVKTIWISQTHLNKQMMSQINVNNTDVVQKKPM